MEKIVERVQKELEKWQSNFSQDQKFQELQRFYLEMKAKGIAKKQEYTLPQLDTIGHTLRNDLGNIPDCSNFSS